MVDEVINEFLIESNENLARLDQEFVLLEKQTDDRNLLGSIFRTIHTIKGTAGFFNFTKLVAITHYGEDILSKMRDGKMTVTPLIINALLASVDAVKEVLASIEASGVEGANEYQDVIKQLQRIAEGKAGAPETAAPAASPKAAIPKPQPVPEKVVECSVAPVGDAEVHAVQAAEPAPVAAPEVAQHEEDPAVVTVVGDVREALAAPADARSAAVDSTIRVEVALLDRLMNLVGELVLTRNQILQYAGYTENKSILSSSQRLNLITTELQENVMKTRMQPINGVWSKLPRLVRDVSQALGKEVDLQMEGAATELDKTILEAVKDPFTHIVRNAMDHGIEAPEERLKKGKPRRGLVRLRAFHEGGQVNIEVSDDGEGINLVKVKRKAIKNGLISEEQAVRMSDREALHLIFSPGFSTAEKVTAISGRGVGMDVVKTNIERIGGVVDIVNNPTHGTTIKIKIPLTLAIIPALIVTASGERFAIPQINLRELVRLEGGAAKSGIEWVQGIEVYRLRGDLLPLMRLRRVLKLDDGKEPENDIVNIVVLYADNRLFGLVVDNVNDTEEIVVKPLAKALKNISVFAGSTIMGDGHVALILDTAGLLQSSDVPHHDIKEEENAIMDDEHAESTLLIFTLGDCGRYAMPLSMVSRLEEFESSKVERLNDGEVVQYRGQVMPVLRMAGQLNVSGAEDGQTLPVIVFSNGDRAIGMAVHQLLDIVDESERPNRSDVSRRGVLGSAIVQGRTTIFVDPYALIDDAMRGFFNHKRRPPAISRMARKKMGRVLLLDDNTFFRNLARTYLELGGYTVFESHGGDAAQQRAQNAQADFVVCDLDSQAKKVGALLDMIRSGDAFKHIPLIALGSTDSVENRERARAAGFDEFLVKLDRDQLLSALELHGAAKTELSRELASVN